MTALWQPGAFAAPTAAQFATLVPILASKPSDQSIPSQTTPQNDIDLLVAVSANVTYEVTALILYGALGAAATGGFKLAWSGPAGATFDWVPTGKIDSDAANTAAAIWVPHLAITDTINMGGAAANTTKFAARPYGFLTVASTPGTFQFKWAQATSNATATIVRTGSRLVLRQVA